MLKPVLRENGYYVCPCHDEDGIIKYRMQYNRREGYYECPGEIWVPIGRTGMKVAQSCIFRYYAKPNGIDFLGALWERSLLFRCVIVLPVLILLVLLAFGVAI